VAQVYVSEKHARVPRPTKELNAFARLELQPGETRPDGSIPGRPLIRILRCSRKEWWCDPGEFEILIGGSVEDIRLRGTISLSKPIAIAPASARTPER
jgi:beta-glucosidase